jgi:hypothetical protein
VRADGLEALADRVAQLATDVETGGPVELDLTGLGHPRPDADPARGPFSRRVGSLVEWVARHV